jgi:hypothetical protein
MIRIRAPQDFGAAIIFLVVGLAGLYFGANLSGMKASGQLGSGTMPRILSWICLGFSALMLYRALRIDRPDAEIVPWRALASVTAAVIVFGFLIERVGYLPTAMATPMIAALGLAGMRWRELPWWPSCWVLAHTAVRHHPGAAAQNLVGGDLMDILSNLGLGLSTAFTPITLPCV